MTTKPTTTTKCDRCGVEILPGEESKLILEDEEDIEFPLLDSAELICQRCSVRELKIRWEMEKGNIQK